MLKTVVNAKDLMSDIAELIEIYHERYRNSKELGEQSTSGYYMGKIEMATIMKEMIKDRWYFFF